MSVSTPFLFSPLTAGALLMNLHYSFNRNPFLLAGKNALRHPCAHNRTMSLHHFASSYAHAQHMLYSTRKARMLQMMCRVEDTRVRLRHRFYAKWSRRLWIIETLALFSSSPFLSLSPPHFPSLDLFYLHIPFSHIHSNVPLPFLPPSHLPLLFSSIK